MTKNLRNVLWLVALAVAVFSAYSFYTPQRVTAVSRPVASSGGSAPQGARSGGASGSRGAPPVAVVTAIAEEKDVPVTRTYVASVEAIASVGVKARADGMVVQQAVAEGQTVKAGDLLFRLDDQIIQAAIAKDRAAIAKDQATLDQANIDLAAIETLLSHGDDTKQQADQQRAAVKIAAATIASDQAQLQADQALLGFRHDQRADRWPGRGHQPLGRHSGACHRPDRDADDHANGPGTNFVRCAGA